MADAAPSASALPPEGPTALSEPPAPAELSAPAAAELADCWDRLRTDSPLVQCLTNIVVAPFTANLLLASGAAPAMVDNPHEAAGFAAVASGVLVNLGTPYDDTVAGMRAAVPAAAAAGTPWVLDPVAVGGLPWRTTTATELLTLAAPAVIRGNASEILALGGGEGGRGVDAAHTPDAALQAAGDLAGRYATTVAVSGPVDLITDGQRLLRLAHGHPWMTKVTGVGCALGALMAGCCAVSDDAMIAAGTATAALTLAAETAADSASGPGSFAVELLDQLFLLEPAELADRVDPQ